METKHIQEFLEIAELKSSYAAAEKMFISQSTLVRHIQAIEDEFGVPLFERSKKGFLLNEAGKKFMPYAKKIAMTQAQCYRVLHSEAENENVVSVCSQGKTIDLFIDFEKGYPAYSIDYHRCSDHLKELRSGKVEVAFLSNAGPAPDGLVSFPFYEEEVLVLVYEGHPFAGRESISLEELQDERFVALAEDTVFDDALAELFGKTGIVKNYVATVPEGNDLLKMVCAKIGIALIHGIKATTLPYDGLRCISLKPGIKYNVSMCYREGVPLSEAAAQFVSFARKWIVWNKDLNLSLFK